MTEPTYLSRPWGRLAYYYERSHEATLVLVHGAWCDAEDWNSMLPFLPPGHGILRLDLRGHGMSGGPNGQVMFDDHVDDILALLDHLDLTAPVLVGHSLGGMLSMRLAELGPERVSGIALLEGWTYLGVPWAAKGEVYGMLPDDIIARIKRKWDQARGRWPKPVLEPYWESVKQANASRFLAMTDLPVLEIYGDRGKMPPRRKDLAIPERPNVEVLYIEDAGHYLPLETPRLVGEAVSAWLWRAGLGLPVP